MLIWGQLGGSLALGAFSGPGTASRRKKIMEHKKGPSEERTTSMGITSPMMQNRLRWRSSSATVKVLRLYIPESYFLEAGEEYRRAGTKLPLRLPDALQFADPTVFAVAGSMAEQVELGAPNLYAEAGARFLAAHLC